MQAKKALEIGTYMITEGQVRSFEQFKVHALFLSTLKPAELYDYARVTSWATYWITTKSIKPS